MTWRPRWPRSRAACGGPEMSEGGGRARFLWGAIVTLLAAAAGAAAVLVARAAAGTFDLIPFFAGTLPLALFVGLLAIALGRDELKLGNGARAALGLTIGAVFGFLWAAVAASLLARFIAEISLPVMPCWIAAGAAGLVSGLTRRPAGGKVAETILLCGFAVALVAASEPVRQALSGDQELHVVFVRWWPDQEEALVGAARPDSTLRRRLGAAGIVGRSEISGRAVHGHGRRALAVVVFTGPLAGRSTIPLPDADTIVYVQKAAAFQMVPENSPTLERTLDLYPNRRDPLRTQYQVRLADGAQEAGVAASWAAADTVSRDSTSE